MRFTRLFLLLVLGVLASVVKVARADDAGQAPPKGIPTFRPQDYGAKADARSVRNANVEAKSTSLTTAAPTFTADDAGKFISVIGAGPDTQPLNATIAKVNNATNVTLSVPANITVTNATIHFASDDREALQSTINAAAKLNESIVDFGTATYTIATTVPSPWHETTGIDITAAERRKSIRFTGKEAKIIRRAITGSGHTSIFTVRNNWDFVEFDGLDLRWEDLKDVSEKFEWWEGIRFTNASAENPRMEKLTIRDCTFWDCNRAWTIAGRLGNFKTIRGQLKHVRVENCRVLYPRGSNWKFTGGGSQGEYMGLWVNLGEVIDCTFDGAIGGDVSHTFAKKPKDGFLMGEPLQRVWRGGVARNFDLEGAYCNVQNGFGRATFIMPEVGQTVTLNKDQIGVQQVVPDDIVRIDQIGAFKVTAKDANSVTLKNLGRYTSANGLASVTNAPPGTAAKNNFIALDFISGDDCSVLVENVRFEGKVWDGTRYRSGNPCIRVDNMRSTIRNCVAIDATVFTLNYQVPADKWLTQFWRTPSDKKETLVTGNCVLLIDADEVKKNWVTGIHNDFSRKVTIEDNIIISPKGQKFRGIDGNTSGNVTIQNNTVIAQTPGQPTSFGITFNNYGGSISSKQNTFKNLGKNTVGDIRARADEKKPPLKVAMLIPIEPWDRKAGLEAWRKWLEEHYRVEITWIEPKTPQPTKETPEKERKEYYANPPEIPDLDKATDADVIFTALTHVAVNEKQSELLLKLLTTKPVVGGRRSHHGMNLKLPKGSAFALKNPGGFSGGYGDLIFGGGYAGHLGGTQQIKEGSADHPIVKGLPDLTKFTLTDRGYKHKIVAEDEVTVLIEMKETKDPQTWCRINKDTKQRTAYTVHDPRDIEAQESVRVMLARALFWAADKNEADYKK